MKVFRGLLVVPFVLLAVACGGGGGGGGGGSLPVFTEIEPNNTPEELNVFTESLIISALTGPGDEDWFGTAIQEPTRFDIEAFPEDPNIAILFEVFPFDGVFEDFSTDVVERGSGVGDAFRGRFVPTGPNPTLFIHSVHAAGTGFYQIEVRLR